MGRYTAPSDYDYSEETGDPVPRQQHSEKPYYQRCGIPKPESRKRVKGRKLRAKAKDTAAIRAYVFARERNLCRCCRLRPAESMHELKPRSLGGRVSRINSVALCGDGVHGCHGLLQRHAITARALSPFGAEAALVFEPQTPTACDWMRLKRGENIYSEPMRAVEAEV